MKNFLIAVVIVILFVSVAEKSRSTPSRLMPAEVTSTVECPSR